MECECEYSFFEIAICVQEDELAGNVTGSQTLVVDIVGSSPRSWARLCFGWNWQHWGGIGIICSADVYRPLVTRSELLAAELTEMNSSLIRLQ